MDIRFIVTPNHELRCWATGLLQEAGWEDAKQIVKVWAWLRNMDVSRIHIVRGDIAFHARFRMPPLVEPFRTACLCGWAEVTETVELMVAVRRTHRTENPTHFRELCLHSGAVKTKPYGEVICVDCSGTLGWDSLAQAGMVPA